MKYRESLSTLLTLSVAGELVAGVASEVLGKQVSDSVAGTPLNQEIMLNMAQSEIEKTLVDKQGKA